MTDPDNQSNSALADPLTRREREILALLAQGLSAAEIAQKLTLAVNSGAFGNLRGPTAWAARG